MKSLRLVCSVLLVAVAGLAASKATPTSSSFPSPPVVTSLTATPSSFTVTWDFTAPPRSTLDVVYVAPLRTQAIGQAHPVPPSSHRFTFTGLESNRLYQVSVVATTPSGTLTSPTWSITTS